MGIEVNVDELNPSKQLFLPLLLDRFSLAGLKDANGAVHAVIAGLDVDAAGAHAVDGVAERGATDAL